MGAPDVAFVRQYQDTIYLLAQQMDSRMRGAVMVDTNWTGEQKNYPQYNQDAMVELMTRYSDTPNQLPDFRNRVVVPRFFVSSTLEDPKDAAQTLVDPKSAFMTAKISAANRTTDDVVISAMGGTALTGKGGTTNVSFSASNQIAFNAFPASGNGLSKAKVLSAQRLLNAAEVEKMDRYFAHSAAQLEDLLNTTEVASSDYNVIKALVEGEIKTWVGFSWIHTERLLTDVSNNRLCYAWHKMAIQLAIQKEIEGRVDERIDKNMAWQVYLKMCMAATRLEESRIVQVACVESAF